MLGWWEIVREGALGCWRLERSPLSDSNLTVPFCYSLARPDFGGNSGGGVKKLVEVQRFSSRPPWKA
jgi:hypothetical protein